MRAAVRMHLEGQKEDAPKTLRCGKCGTGMRKRPEKRLGLNIDTLECPRCGKRLIGMDDAVRLQERASRRMREIQKTLGDAARRKGISKKDLLISIKAARKRK